MARIVHVYVDGVEQHIVDVGGVAKIVVQDEDIERHIEFTATGIEETIVNQDGNTVDTASSDYEDIHSLCAADYSEDEDEDEDEDEEEWDEDFDVYDEDDGDEDDTSMTLEEFIGTAKPEIIESSMGTGMTGTGMTLGE